MQPDIKVRLLKYLYDALNAAEDIVVHTSGLNVAVYQSSKVKWIVERN